MLQALKLEPTDSEPADPREEEMVDQLVRDCAGDPRQAILGLLRFSTQLVQKNEQLASLISTGFVRRDLQRLYDLCP